MNKIIVNSQPPDLSRLASCLMKGMKQILSDALPDANQQNQSVDLNLSLSISWLWLCVGFDYTPTTVSQPFFRDHPGEPVPEENFWTLWHKGRLTEADTATIQLGATPSGLSSAHLHHPLHFLQARCPSCCPTNSVKALKATSAFRLGRRHYSSPQWCYLQSPYLWFDNTSCQKNVPLYFCL